MEPELSTSDLPLIDAALVAQGWLAPMPRKLLARYQRDQLAQRRPHNRRVLLAMLVIFDLFVLAQHKSAPEIVPLSAVLRFAVMTPGVLLFVFLDGRNRLGRAYGPFLVTLAVLASVISAVLIYLTYGTTTTNMSDVRATPLILLSTGLIMRLTPPEVISNALLSMIVFIAAILVSPSVHSAELGSLILTDIAIGAAAIVFNLQLETRDRRVFLLRMSEQINRAELAARNSGLLQQTQTDGLTGVANRRCFDVTLAETWRQAQESGSPVGLIILDIDHFKAFNDFYGHQGGDDCLRLVAAKARREVRADDLFARFGGEEFAVILPGAPLEMVEAAAERIRACVENLGLRHGGNSKDTLVTVSIGAASLTPGKGDDVRHLFEAADTNLYAAKRSGRNRVCTQDNSVAKAYDSRQALQPGVTENAAGQPLPRRLS